MQDLTLLGHVAFLRHYAVQLNALACASPAIAAKLRQIAYSLDADADQLETVTSGTGLSEEQEQAFYGAPPAPAGERPARTGCTSGAARADCLDAIPPGGDAAVHWPRP